MEEWWTCVCCSRWARARESEEGAWRHGCTWVSVDGETSEQRLKHASHAFLTDSRRTCERIIWLTTDLWALKSDSFPKQRVLVVKASGLLGFSCLTLPETLRWDSFIFHIYTLYPSFQQYNTLEHALLSDISVLCDSIEHQSHRLFIYSMWWLVIIVSDHKLY